MPENIIIGFLLGSFTTLLGSLAAHFLSKDRDMRKGFNEAASIFRNTFERILATIYQNPDLSNRQIVDDILIKNYPDQRIAMGNLSRQMWERGHPLKGKSREKTPLLCKKVPFFA
jgi:dsRNA-specific ribonuclease